jgi:multiple sugar transport system permease protein
MAAPAVLGLVLFIACPFLLAVIFSFTNLRLGSPLPTEFVGWEQFKRVLADSTLHRALLNNFLFALVVVPLQTAFALGLALLVNQRLKGMPFFRTVFFLPTVFPMALLAVVWQLIYAPGPDGLMNSLLGSVSFGAWKPCDFLRDPHLALPAVMLLSIWQGAGFQMVILLAGLQNIPAHLYEAADIEGAGEAQKFFHITLPGLRNTLISVALITSILAFRLFDQIQIMTQGGPNNATTTLMYEAVKTAFTRQRIGKGAAITVVFFILVLGVSALQQRFFRHEKE